MLLKRHVCASKYEPFVDKVELLEANLQYADIRHQNCSESTVSLHDLAPLHGQNTEDATKEA